MKLIQIKDYLLLIDEEVVCKTGELYLTSILNRIIPKCKGVIQAGDKIIAYLPINSEAKELDLPLLPPFEDADVEKLAKKWFLINNYNQNDKILSNRADSNYITNKNLFIEGYKAAQAKQFSLEDMKKAIVFAFNAGRRLERKAVSPDFSFEIYREEFIQSLSNQQLPSEFFPEFDIVHTDHAPNGFEKVLKFKTNSEGKQELVGTYKYR